MWVHDVFAFRGSPAAWEESLIAVRDVVTVSPTDADLKKLHRLGSGPLLARFTDDDGEQVDFATTAEHALDLLGPFGTATVTKAPSPSAER